MRLLWAGIFLTALLLGAGCHGGSPTGDHISPLAPVPLHLAAGVVAFEPSGATTLRGVKVVITKDSSSCKDWRTRLGEKEFVVCSFAPSNEISRGVKGALRELKRAYPLHVGKPPIGVAIDEERLDDGLGLAAEEPTFFATLLVRGRALEGLSIGRTSDFGARGGKRLLIVGGNQDVEARVQAGTRPTGAGYQIFPDDERGLSAAVAEFTSQ